LTEETVGFGVELVVGLVVCPGSGLSVGEFVGPGVSLAVVGLSVGLGVGAGVGLSVGLPVGLPGETVVARVGLVVGPGEGLSVGLFVGSCVALVVVGLSVGLGVGICLSVKGVDVARLESIICASVGSPVGWGVGPAVKLSVDPTEGLSVGPAEGLTDAGSILGLPGSLAGSEDGPDVGIAFTFSSGCSSTTEVVGDPDGTAAGAEEGELVFGVASRVAWY